MGVVGDVEIPETAKALAYWQGQVDAARANLALARANNDVRRTMLWEAKVAAAESARWVAEQERALVVEHLRDALPDADDDTLVRAASVLYDRHLYRQARS